ncbi:S-layer homology domain-containing protein [Anaerolentibacter hominis]|uniref:S-layer homology domain-containing protein n=1 Tax=Anaerolentibacter hominis TaxID=3079009 RepID=UPI0031B8036C
MKKKTGLVLFCLLLAVSSVCNRPQNVNAAKADPSQSEVEQVITALGIMTPDKNGDMQLSQKVTRAQFAKMLVMASSYKDKVPSSVKVSLFKDVTYKHSAAGYIKIAVEQGWMSGYLNGSFKPSQKITLAEAVKGITGLLGYTASDFTGVVTDGQMALYQSKGLDKNITVSKNTSKLTRKNCMNLFYNTMTADTKTGQIYAETLGYTLNSAGELDYLSLISTQMTGPVTAAADWTSQLPFSASKAVYYRNGETSSKESICTYDVLYYSKNLKTVWAYSDKVTGTYESADPDRIAPTGITVAGNAYTLGSQKASIAVSTLGNFQPGDTVTLLFGKDGTVVDVIEPSSVNSDVCGIVTACSSRSITEPDGSIGTTYSITMIDAQGNTYQYNCEKKLSAGTLVQAAAADGVMKISTLEKTVVTGTFNDEGTRLGSTLLAEDVHILDYNSETSKTIYPERLAGVTLYYADILYCGVNDAGKITELILNDVTGDLYEYGLLTSVTETSGNNNYSGSYTYDIKGTQSSYSSNGFIFGAAEGPSRFGVSQNKLTSIRNLSSAYAVSVNSTTLKTVSASYPISDQAAVYLKETVNGTVTYYYTTLSKVNDLDKFSLIGYYDQSPSRCGKIRVIVATKKNS